MILDDSRSPLVFLRRHLEPEAANPADDEVLLERLLDRGHRFVLITDHATDDHAGETAEERRQRAAFFKRIKDRMQRLCRGMIVLEGDRPLPAPIRALASTASKAFGFPVAFARDETEAIRLGERLLAPPE
ncbi:hypothetical protein [Stenotrophomonas sp. 24(2023)]|uniref:hypothetical protein n=1 Tax=Stenotrophomonas sp. 24(2023) TaxID=3068324 RepID=UPI0027DFD93B|nr:hypothetical protein [Stenotrophomonas sp. 24(2023)]WMJ68956.1 hypothetical protein Q9R17_17510 [Stenotrophomonas sp. 24(2023)]